MDIIRQINWVDALVIILFIRISYVAFQEGLSHEIFPLIGVVLTIILSLNYYKGLGSAISRNLFNLPIDLSNFLSFLILAIIAGLLVKVLKALLDKIIKVEWHPFIERFGGLAVGVLRASIFASLILIILSLMPLSYLQWSIRDRSLLGMRFLKIGPTIYSKGVKFLPMVRIGQTSVEGDNVLNDIVSDKTVEPKMQKDRREWEEELEKGERSRR